MTDAGLATVGRTVWWFVLVRGILALLFGLFALIAPASTALALVIVFGVYAVLDGVTAVATGLRHRRDEAHWVWHVVLGVVSVLAGIVAFVWPGATVLAILLVIAFWSVVGGIVEIMEALAMRRRGSSTWGWILAAGILSVLFGIVLVVQPGAGLVTLLWLVGAYAVVFGAILIWWAFQLRRGVAAVR